MKKIMMTMAAASAFALSAPAAAQYAGSNIQLRIQELQNTLQAGIQRRLITRAEALPLRDQLSQLNQLARQYSRDGLTRGERDILAQRIQVLRQQIRMASRNDDYRGGDGGYDYGNGRDCPPGLAKKNNGCMPPGQAKKNGDRYNQNWGGVPSQWQQQYRDTNRYMFRYNDGRVYQIDRRTGTIVRVFNVR